MYILLNRCRLRIKIFETTYINDDFVGVLIFDEKFCKYPRKIIGLKRIDFEEITLECKKPVLLIEKDSYLLHILTKDGEYVISLLKIIDILSELSKIF